MLEFKFKDGRDFYISEDSNICINEKTHTIRFSGLDFDVDLVEIQQIHRVSVENLIRKAKAIAAKGVKKAVGISN